MPTFDLPWEGLSDNAPAATRIAALAAREIVQGIHRPGDPLNEAGLAQAHGASRTPAREAMLRLESWGLVRLLPKKGAIVTSVTTAERRDLLAVRAMFEISAVERLATGAGDLAGLADEVAAILDRQRMALDAGDILAFAGHDYAFHARIIEAGENSVVAGLLSTLGPRFARLTHQAISDNPGYLDTLLAEHQQLAEQARAGDATGFADLVRRHIAGLHFAAPDRG